MDEREVFFVGDVVTKGKAKTHWYVTAAHGQDEWRVYALSTKPDGNKTGAAYSALSLTLVSRKGE